MVATVVEPGNADTNPVVELLVVPRPLRVPGRGRPRLGHAVHFLSVEEL